jgi:hypothetical protein
MDVLKELLRGTPPAFAAGGRTFYGKMPQGSLRFYHYMFPPAAAESFSNYRWMGKRVEGYLKLLESSNGLVLFDKSLAIYGIGDDISRSLNPADFTAFSFERENILFLHGSEKAPNPVVGTVELTQRYQMELEPSGRCLLRGEDGFERRFGDLDEALHAIIAYLQAHLEFGAEAKEENLATVEQLIRT